jgi:hypothetical protein
MRGLPGWSCSSAVTFRPTVLLVLSRNGAGGREGGKGETTALAGRVPILSTSLGDRIGVHSIPTTLVVGTTSPPPSW